MEKLNELARLVTGFITPDNANKLFSVSKVDPKALKLLESVLRNQFGSDEEAAKAIYRCKPADKKYQMLKSRVKNQLLQLVFTMDLGKRIKSKYAKAWYRAHKNLFVCRQLIQLGYRGLVADKLKETFTLATHFDFTDIQLATARIIRDHEAFTGNVKRINELSDSIYELKKRLDDEISVEKYFQIIRSILRKAVTSNENTLQIAEDCFNKSQQLVKSNSSPSNAMIGNAYRIAIYYYHLINNHLQSIEVCNQFESYLVKNPNFIEGSKLAEINMQKLDTALYLRNYELGNKSAKKCLNIFNKQVSNWIVVQEAYFLLCLHTENYDKAYVVIKEVKSHPNFSKFPKDRIERWKIFEAFLTYILPVDKRRKQFNVHRFVNEVPVFSKDKIGYNFSIIVAQVVLLVKEGDFDRVMDKYESLKSYARRYISLERSPRSYYFVKMLLTMIKYDFDPVKTESVAAKFFDKLCAARIGNQGELETLEVIPYDILWPDLLGNLRTHKRELLAV